MKSIYKIRIFLLLFIPVVAVTSCQDTKHDDYNDDELYERGVAKDAEMFGNEASEVEDWAEERLQTLEEELEVSREALEANGPSDNGIYRAKLEHIEEEMEYIKEKIDQVDELEGAKPETIANVQDRLETGLKEIENQVHSFYPEERN